MKKTITLAMLLVICFIGFAQSQDKVGIIKKNQKGIITSVKFSAAMEKDKIPSTADAFFQTYLDVNSNDQFEKAFHKSKRKEFVHDHFDQYYKGIKVDGAGYNLHYKNGQMYFANGNFVKVGNVNSSPSISLDEAIISFLNYKEIENEKVSSTITELLIKEITDTNSKNDSGNTKLVYRIYLEADHKNNNEVGYVDAHTGKVVMIEPRLTHTTGTFATRYSGTRQAETDPVTGGHRLLDDTRDAFIHTRNLQNNTTTIANAVELIDNNNNWTTAEHGANNNDMGLDVHWGLQEIYDHLFGTHGIDSFDDNGVTINAYVRYGTNTDNAFWNPTVNVLLFGQGNTIFRPVASLDVVAHEFGHGITDFQIGWNNSGNEGAFNEGLSDIWGAILEQRILPNSVWQLGEQITLSSSYLRNIQNTNDTNALSQIADTFQSSQYNNSTDIYLRSGVFSHWFYILANGESGTNDIGNSYNVSGIGLDLAEELIVEAVFNNYLDNTTTYPAIRTAFINAAEAIFCENSSEVQSVTDAWYAVGVGNAFQNASSITGPINVCSSGVSFTVNNLPVGATISWSTTSNITRNSSQGSNPCTFSANGNGTGWIRATIVLPGNCGNPTMIQNDVQVGNPTLTNNDVFVRDSYYNNLSGSGTSFDPYLICNGGEEHVINMDSNNVNSINYTTIPSGWTSYSYGVYEIAFTPNNMNYGNTYAIDVDYAGACGNSVHTMYFKKDDYCFGGYFKVVPNPITSTELNIVKKNNNETEAFNTSYEVEFLLFNDKGVQLKSKKDVTNKENYSLNIPNLKNGIYYLKIITEKHTEVHRILVDR